MNDWLFLYREINIRNILFLRIMKQLFLVFSFLIVAGFALESYSQQPTQEWVSRWPSSSPVSSGGQSIKSDSTGNIYVLADTGRGFGFLKYDRDGNLILTAHTWPGNPYNGGGGAYFDVSPSGDVYITGGLYIDLNEWIYTAKFNSNGTLQWGKIYNSDMGDIIKDIAVDNVGDAIIVGGTWNGGNIGYALAIKYNSNGDTLWVSHFNDGPTDAGYSKVVLDNSNNIFVTGDITYVGVCLVTKYAPNGNLIWHQRFTLDSLRTNLGIGINLDQTGNLYVIGTQVTPPPLPYKSFIVKFNNSGNVVWSVPYSGYATGNKSIWGPVLSSDGNQIYYTVSTEDTVGTGINITTLKYNSSGVLEWAKVYNGGVQNSPNLASGIKLDKYQNIYVCGTGFYQTTGSDFTTLKYLSNGSLAWVTSYTGIVANGYDEAMDLFIDTSLNVYVTGFSKKTINSNFDAVTIKYSQTVGINKYNNQTLRNFTLGQNYPNPFNPMTVIEYQIPKASNIKLTLYGISGEVVKLLVNSFLYPGNYSIVLNMEDMASGIYFYRLVANDKIISVKKLVLIK